LLLVSQCAGFFKKVLYIRIVFYLALSSDMDVAVELTKLSKQ